jgi:AcrR family transcriptional regulator
MPRKNAKPKILEAARDCIIAGGGEFEMADVARAAGVSEGLAYHYFGSKSGLMAAAVAEFYDRYGAVLNRRHDGSVSWPVRERRRLEETVAFLCADPMTAIVFGRLGRTPEVAALEAERIEEMIGLAARNIALGVERGDVPPQIDTAIAGAAITGAIRQTVMYGFGAYEDPPVEALTEQLWRMITGALGLKAEAAAPDPA